jgi:hypothetical protein
LIPVNGKNEKFFNDGKKWRERNNFKERETPTGEGKEMNPLGGLKEDSDSENEAT